MNKWNKQEDIDRELSRILSEVSGVSREIKRIEQEVNEIADYRIDPVGSVDLDFEFVKYKARRTMRERSSPSGSLA